MILPRGLSYFRAITIVNLVLLLAVCVITSMSNAVAQSAENPFDAMQANQTQHVIWQDVKLIDGKILSADQLNRETVIVQFWATWCPFCARQNPNIEALHRSAAGRFRVLTFSIDQLPKTVIDYQRAKSYSFDVAMLPASDKVGNDIFGKRIGLPEVIVVKPGGAVATRIPGEMFEEDVRELPTKYGDVK
jgi:thiol-disulfide isomerase/thioredoxin